MYRNLVLRIFHLSQIEVSPNLLQVSPMKPIVCFLRLHCISLTRSSLGSSMRGISSAVSKTVAKSNFAFSHGGAWSHQGENTSQVTIFEIGSILFARRKRYLLVLCRMKVSK
mmetsp:Transcript_2310/g.4214  ORF Transcript_2310/g.4214 Transcript_2310/m.4214 type:complete len:112 (-) Transcript_2310:16-351(-)